MTARTHLPDMGLGPGRCCCSATLLAAKTLLFAQMQNRIGYRPITAIHCLAARETGKEDLRGPHPSTMIPFTASLGTKQGEVKESGRSRMILRSLFVHYVFVSLVLSIAGCAARDPRGQEGKLP